MYKKGGIVSDVGGKLKFEVVGDVLMIPENVLCVAPWNEENTGSEMLKELWAGLATCFGVSRVARKAKIDNGPKVSWLHLLLPIFSYLPASFFILILFSSPERKQGSSASPPFGPAS